MPTQFGRLLAGGRALGVDAGIVLRVDPLHLAGGLLERVEATLRALHSHLLVLRDGVQGLDDRVCSLAAACGHLCDTYLSERKSKRREERKEKIKVSIKRKNPSAITSVQPKTDCAPVFQILPVFHLSVSLGLFPPRRALLLPLC